MNGKILGNPEDIKMLLISHNTAYLSQTQGTSFTIAPLNDQLGTDSYTIFTTKILQGTTDTVSLPLSNH